MKTASFSISIKVGNPILMISQNFLNIQIMRNMSSLTILDVLVEIDYCHGMIYLSSWNDRTSIIHLWRQGLSLLSNHRRLSYHMQKKEVTNNGSIVAYAIVMNSLYLRSLRKELGRPSEKNKKRKGDIAPWRRPLPRIILPSGTSFTKKAKEADFTYHITISNPAHLPLV